MDMDIFETGHTRLRRTLRNILSVIIPAVLCLIFIWEFPVQAGKPFPGTSSLQQAWSKAQYKLMHLQVIIP